MLIANKFNGYSKDGRRLYNCDDGGQPQQQSQTVTNLSYPDEFKPLVKEMGARALAQASSPYVAYNRNRIAGFDPLQLTAQQAVANITPSQQLGPATQFASSAGLKAGNVQYDPMAFRTGSFTNPGVAEQYMSPYAQNVIDIQNREARRAADIANQQQQAKAVGQNAFGGSRSAIVQAEANRTLQQQLGDIQARGQQAAYEQAQNLYSNEQQRAMQAQQATEQSRQFGAGVGLQGLQTQLNAASQLANLGGQEFQQQKDIINALSSAGQQRQGLVQQKMSQDYQDFLTQKQFPYQQLAFMAEILKGVPQNTTQSIYQVPPSMLSQAAGLGLAGYGLFGGGGKAAGGKIEEDHMDQGYPGLGELAMYNAMQRARG